MYSYLVCFLINFVSSSALSKHPILLIVAFDGFRHDYLERNLTPALKSIAIKGTKAKFMLNQFPTVTLPNFHSIATGMYPESHGVLGNEAFSEQGECLKWDYDLLHYNEDVIPMWLLNEYSADERYSGIVLWPGSSYPYQQKTPTYTSFDYNTTWQSRVDMVLEWITNDQKPANLVHLYFNQPDGDSHKYGPDTPQVEDQLKNINKIVVYLEEQINLRNLTDKINIMFLSDHGMITLNTSRMINIHQYLDPNTYTVCGESPVLQILPKPGNESNVYETLVQISNQTDAFVVYKPDEIPDRWHFKRNRRNKGFLIQAKMEYFFQDAEHYKGDHGYDPDEPKMHPIFIAQGPLFKKHYEVEPFQNIDIYPLISHIMNLKPPPAHVTPNGTLNIIKNILINP